MAQLERNEALSTPMSRRDVLMGAAAFLPWSGIVPVSPMSNVPADRTWEIQSVDMMKVSKDNVHNQLSDLEIAQLTHYAKDVGATHVAISTPYDDPEPFRSVEYTRRWVNHIRAEGMNVWHRHMPLQFEGIYDRPKKRVDYRQMISDYIINNPDFFEDGDIFAPLPEPQGGGIQGVTGCSQDVCQFDDADDFNSALREYVEVSKSAFDQIGKKVSVGFYGLDGFIIAGLDNPDHEGTTYLEDETVEALDNIITADHYPADIHRIKDDYQKMHQIFPDVQFAVGEFNPQGHADSSISDEELMQRYREDLEAFRNFAWIIAINVWPFVKDKNGQSENERESMLRYNQSTGEYEPTFLYEILKSFFNPRAT